MTTILEARDLHKTFRTSLWTRPVQALRGLSFSVHEGECFGLLGRNGAGKTTTLKIATGQILADQGAALLLGRSGREPSARRPLGYLPENPYFHEHLSPMEGLELFGRLQGLSAKDIAERSPQLLERVGLTQAAGRRVRGFSKGMRQRYGLAAALLSRPRLLLLDEPLSGLDPGGRRLVKELVLEERQRGTTVVLCSHVLGDVQELCERVVVVHEGAVVRGGTIQELLDADAQSWELCATQIGDNLRRELVARAERVLENGERLRLRLPGADSGPQAAAEVHRAGGRVLALVPERESLESWFVRLTSNAVESVGSLQEEGVLAS